MMGYTNPATAIPENNGGGGGNDQFGGSSMMGIMSPDSFNGRKLRPLIPRPSASAIPAHPTCFNHTNCDTASNFFTLNHHMAAAASHHHLVGVEEQAGKRESFMSGHQHHQSVVVSSSRWNPTPEQLRALEELYRRGTRTPSADQIQHITAQLRRYGKIEGKNVFYWFQNHKARERQKRRRQQLENSSSSPNHQQSSHNHLHQDQQPKDQPSGDLSNHNDNKGTTGFEIEQTKLWPAPANCSTLADQGSVHRTEKATAGLAAAAAAAECVTDDEWVQFQDHHNSLQIASTAATTMLQDTNDTAGEHRRRRTSLNLLLTKNATWDSSHHLSLPTPSAACSYFKPATVHQISMLNNEDIEDENNDQCSKEEGGLTLELFPLQSNGAMDLIKDDEDEIKATHSTPFQFFEFLPLKNSNAN